MTGTYPSFMATQDGRAILGRQPTLQDMLRSVAQGAPTSTGGYGGAPQGLGYPGGGQTFITGTGDRAMGSPYFNLTFGQPAAGGGSAGPAIGGGGRGIALPPGANTPSTPVPGQGVPTGAGGGAGGGVAGAPGGALTVQQLLRQLGIAGGGTGGGGAGGAGGTAPGGIGAGQTAPESGERFAAANAAVNPSAMSALNIAGSVMSPLTGLPSQLLSTAFPGLNVLGLGGGFNVKGPQLSPQQLNQLSQAYQQNPALAARLLATMRQQANIAGGAIGGGMLNRTGVTPMGSFGTTPSNELTANFTSPGFGLNPPATGFGGYATWGGPGGGFEGGGGLGGSPDTGGGLGGGVGNMGGGQNRSF